MIPNILKPGTGAIVLEILHTGGQEEAHNEAGTCCLMDDDHVPLFSEKLLDTQLPDNAQGVATTLERMLIKLIAVSPAMAQAVVDRVDVELLEASEDWKREVKRLGGAE